MHKQPTPVLGGGPADSAAWQTVQDARTPIRLIVMPLIAVCRPALGPGLLKAALARAGHASSIVYANMLYAETFYDLYRMLETCSYYRVTDWIFAPTVFPGYDPPDETYLEQAVKHMAQLYKFDAGNPDVCRAMARVLTAARHTAQVFIDRLAEALLQGRPRIIGCSSVFEQHIAALGLLKAVRARNPGVVTVMGGANCQGRMGVATAREFDWVDYVFSGEAEDIFPDFCAAIMRHGRRALPADGLPPGVITGAMAAQLGALPDADLPRHVVQDIDKIPAPDYTEYFAALSQCHDVGRHVTPALLAESSRGCWWRQKQRCTFCGLNGSCADFRVKHPARVLDELRQLTARYRINRVEMADNILDMGYFKSLFPALADDPPDYNLFYETKANLTRRHIELLHAAGVTWIQPGVESLHDRLLKLMNKGTTALQNVQMLKYTCEKGMRASWAMLAAFPEEDDAWHLETARWLPLIFHLQPPFQVLTMLFQRFSVYHDQNTQNQLRLRPSGAYRMAYPFTEPILAELAYYFELDGHSDIQRSRPPGIRALRRQVERWKKARALPAVLCLEENQDGSLGIYDTRPCAPQRRRRLEGPAADVYRACEPVVSAKRLMERMRRMQLPEYEPAVIDQTVRTLIRQHLLLALHGRLLALAVPGDIPSIPGIDKFPGGFAHGGDCWKVLAAGEKHDS